MADQCTADAKLIQEVTDALTEMNMMVLYKTIMESIKTKCQALIPEIQSIILLYDDLTNIFVSVQYFVRSYTIF